MRRAAITFVGLVAGIASCSSYGETTGANDTPSSIDGGSSSGTGTGDGGNDGLVSNDAASPIGDHDGDAADGRHVTTIVQVTSGVVVSTPDQLSLSFDKNVTPGNTVLLFTGIWGASVKLARLGSLVLDAISTEGHYPTQTALLKAVPDGLAAGSQIEVQLDAVAGTPLAIAVELANAGPHTQSTNNGTGNVALEVIAQPPTLVIANVVGNGSPPAGPLNAQPLGKSSDASGQEMLSAWKVVTDLTSPKIRWTANDAFQWQATMVAFQPGL
jgi:hypothetical protein